MATCFDPIKSSSGLPKNRSNASKFIVHFDTLDLFFGRPDEDSIESKHFQLNQPTRCSNYSILLLVV